MDTVRRVGHQVSLRLVAAALFAVSLLGTPQASLAGFGNTVATYDVSFQNLSPANGSYLLWRLDFGTPSSFPTVVGGLSLDVDFRLPTFPCAFFAPTGCADIIPGYLLPDTGVVLPTLDSVFYTPGPNTIDLTNFELGAPPSMFLASAPSRWPFGVSASPATFRRRLRLPTRPAAPCPCRSRSRQTP